MATAELAYRESIAYAKQREAFGKPISGFQVIRHKLADMATRIAAARALPGQCVARHLRGEQQPSLAAMAKNAATDMCSWVCDEAVQIHGGAGYLRETVVERAVPRMYQYQVPAILSCSSWLMSLIRTAVPDPCGAAHEKPEGWCHVRASTMAFAPSSRARCAIDK